MTIKDDIALLPCPFCGGEKFIIVDPHGGGDTYAVECQKCWCCLGANFSTESAIKQWNTRATMTPTTDRQAALDALEELANTSMHISLADWSRICSTIRAALTEPAPVAVPVIEGLEEAIKNLSDCKNASWAELNGKDVNDLMKLLQAARAYQQLSTKNEAG